MRLEVWWLERCQKPKIVKFHPQVPNLWMVKHLTEALTCARWPVQDDTFGGLNSHFFIILWMCERQLNWLLYETTEHVTANRLIQETTVNNQIIQSKHSSQYERCSNYLTIWMTFSNLMVLLDSHRTEKCFRTWGSRFKSFSLIVFNILVFR